MTRLAWKTQLFTAGAMALGLAACNDRDARSTAPPPALAVLDPTAGRLPPAPPAPVGRYEPARGYRLAERAYGVQRAVYETPPDYGFAYGQEEPLAWETADDWSMYAEPWDDGYRYYYYQPGETYPYFVRDDDYGYGYDRGGTLVAVVDSAGRYLPAEEYRRVAPIAGRYYAHGRDLRRAGQQSQRIRVDERTWAAHAPRVTEGADRWLTAAREDQAWRQWREADRNRELDRFTAEQVRRAQAQRARMAEQSRDEVRRDDFRRGDVLRDGAGRDNIRRDDDQRRLAEQQLRQDQARAADRQDRDAAARVQAERQMQAERQVQAERAAVDQRQRAEAERRRGVDTREAQAREAQARAAQARDAQARDAQVREAQARDVRAGQQQADARRREQHQAQEAQAQVAHDRQMQADARQREQHQAQQAQAQAARDRQTQERAQSDARRQAEQAQAREARDRQAQAQNQQREAQRAQQVQARAAQDQARAAEQNARAAAAHERASPPPRQPDHPHPNGKPDDRGKDKERKD